MKELRDLIKVKTIVTMALTAVFCFLSVMQVVPVEIFMTVYTVVIAFYFGSQHEKDRKDGDING